MRKRALVLFIIIILCFTGCTKKTAQKAPTDDVKEKIQIEVTLYYANAAYIETGDEKLDKFIPVKTKISDTENSIPLSVLKELQKAPVHVERANSNAIKKISFLDVQVKDGIAYVDISSKDLNGGSLEEFYIISQIVYTLTSLEDIEKVQFLVDGQVQETLMGHFMIDKPFDKNSEL